MHSANFVVTAWAALQAMANQALELVGAESTAPAAGGLLREIGAWGPHMHPATLAYQQQAGFDEATEVDPADDVSLMTAKSEQACLT